QRLRAEEVNGRVSNRNLAKEVNGSAQRLHSHRLANAALREEAVGTTEVAATHSRFNKKQQRVNPLLLRPCLGYGVYCHGQNLHSAPARIPQDPNPTGCPGVKLTRPQPSSKPSKSFLLKLAPNARASASMAGLSASSTRPQTRQRYSAEPQLSGPTREWEAAAAV